jgi:VanZ family protein
MSSKTAETAGMRDRPRVAAPQSAPATALPTVRISDTRGPTGRPGADSPADGLRPTFGRMRRPRFINGFAVLTALAAAVILYGCLYPFRFRVPSGGVGPVHELVRGWAEWHGRGDFLSNILLYTPLGFFAVLATRRSGAAWKRILPTVLGGAALSLSVELTQYYDVGRTTAAVDFYWNVLGTGLGAAMGWLIGGDAGGAALAAIRENLAVSMLLAAWLAYRLFSCLPAGNPRRVALPAATGGEFLLRAATWLTAGMLLAAIVERRRLGVWFPLLAVAMLGLRAATAGAASAADILGAAVGFAWLLSFGATRFGAAAAVLLIGVAAVLQLPMAGAAPAAAGQFGWLPFVGYAKGAERDVVSFLQKCFLYGGAIWLLEEAGLRLSRSSALVVGALLALAWGQARLFGLPAETGDAVLALLMAATLTVLASPPQPTPDEPARMC